MEGKPQTWSPPPELFGELVKEVKLYSPVKYVSWSLEAVRFTVKRGRGQPIEIIEVPNDPENVEETFKRAKEELKNVSNL